MARMSKITRIIYLTDEIIGSRQPTGRINRIIKVVADRNVNRVTVFGRAVIVRGNIVEEWISAKEPHVVYGLPEGTYILHEELPPYAEGYVSAEDIEFEVKEDGSVTKVEMKDDYSKVEISKTDITTGEELEGAKLQILNKEGEILEEWVTDGKPHLVEKLPVGEELTLREITAPEGYEIAEDVKFTLEDTMEIQKVEMKDARTPETPGVPQTGDDHWKPILLFVLLGASAAGLMATMIYKKRHKKADEAKKEE